MGSTIESGTDFSHYRVIGPIGAGGMGEVYKAHDTKLERTIALKILPPGLVRNEERLRRFMQEARSASSLNHPHIVTIHEIGETTIASDAPSDTPTRSIHYIAMELVDGLTLKRKIHEERTDLRSLLGYMAQAADGLAKAHAAGIVHRDLKPENIMVTRDGFAKVLDFGLAKLNVKKGATEATLSEATEIRDETREGSILGTVAYMSPEQVQGKVVDHRSDIFSFGAILYEAATRRRPFEADSDVDVMHKIMHDKPVPVDEIDASIPAEVRRMIRRCLAKDPDKRYQSMKDLSLELRELVDEYDELSASTASRPSRTSSQSVVIVSPQRRRMIWAGATLIAVLAIASVGFGVYQWRQAQTTRSAPAQFASMKMQKLTATGNVAGVSISPDGRYLAYGLWDNEGRQSLMVRQISTGSDVQVVEPGHSFSGARFSPDGDYIYYSRREGNTVPVYSWLYQVPVLGGTTRKILFDIDTRVAFSPDGKQLAFGRGIVGKNENHYIIANVDGSGERHLATVTRTGSRNPVPPAWSPDGRRLATAVGIPPLNVDYKLVEIDIESGAIRDIGKAEWWLLNDLSWTPDGKALVLSGSVQEIGRSQLWIQPYPDGPPRRITNDLNDYRMISLTADGKTAVTIQTDRDFRLSLGDPADPAGGTLLSPDSRRRAWEVSASAAGPLVFTLADDASSDVAVLESPTERPRLLTSDGKSWSASISGDGKTIAFGSWRDEVPHVWITDSEGGRSRQLTTGDGEFLGALAPDGSSIVYSSGNNLWRLPTSGGVAVRVHEDESASVHSPAISRDSSRIAYLYTRADGGVATQYLRVQPLKGGPPILDVPWDRSTTIRWLPNGEALSYVWGRGAANIFVQPLSGGEPSQVTHYEQGAIDSYDWTSDGKLAIIRGEIRRDAVLITGLE
jgi:eukaryotic-like serine/threonine-protein kinase